MAEFEITEEMIRAGQDAWGDWMELVEYADSGTRELVTKIYLRMKALEPDFGKSGSGGR
jgi:hypothetical protein